MGYVKNPNQKKGGRGCFLFFLFMGLFITFLVLIHEPKDRGQLYRSVDTVETIINTRGNQSLQKVIRKKELYKSDSLGTINILESEFKSAHYSGWNGDNTYFHVIYEVERYNYKN